MAGRSQLKQFIERARDGSSGARAALLRDLADLYLAQPNALSDKARTGFDAVMAQLCSQADPATRRAVAARIMDAPAAPKQLMVQLVRSEIDIAAPLLRHALTLSDDELIAVIDEAEPERLAAIAARKRLSARLVDRLIASGDDGAMAALVGNHGAALSPGAMRRLLAAARRDPALQRPLTLRYDLPANLLIRMFFFISPALRQDLLARAGMIDQALVCEAIDSTREALLSPAADDGGEQAEARAVLMEKAASGRIDEALLIALLNAGEAAMAELAFAYIAGIDAEDARAIFKDASLETLAVACRASSLSRDMFAALARNITGASGGRLPSDNPRAPLMLDLYERISPEIAERLMRFWRMRARAGQDAAKVASLLKGADNASTPRPHAG